MWEPGRGTGGSTRARRPSPSSRGESGRSAVGRRAGNRGGACGRRGGSRTPRSSASPPAPAGSGTPAPGSGAPRSATWRSPPTRKGATTWSVSGTASSSRGRGRWPRTRSAAAAKIAPPGGGPSPSPGPVAETRPSRRGGRASRRPPAGRPEAGGSRGGRAALGGRPPPGIPSGWTRWTASSVAGAGPRATDHPSAPASVAPPRSLTRSRVISASIGDRRGRHWVAAGQEASGARVGCGVYRARGAKLSTDTYWSGHASAYPCSRAAWRVQ